MYPASRYSRDREWLSSQTCPARQTQEEGWGFGPLKPGSAQALLSPSWEIIGTLVNVSVPLSLHLIKETKKTSLQGSICKSPARIHSRNIY